MRSPLRPRDNARRPLARHRVRPDRASRRRHASGWSGDPSGPGRNRRYRDANARRNSPFTLTTSTSLPLLVCDDPGRPVLGRTSASLSARLMARSDIRSSISARRAAAAASSMSRPGAEALQPVGRGDRVGIVVGDGVGKDVARAGRGLEAARPPAAIDVEPRHRCPGEDRRAVGRHVDDAAPGTQHLHAREDREHLADGFQRVLQDVQPAGLRIGIILVRAAPMTSSPLSDCEM